MLPIRQAFFQKAVQFVLPVVKGTLRAPTITREYSVKGIKTIGLSIDEAIKEQFPRHPFETMVTKANAEGVLKRYAAMSQAFPYIQSAAFDPLIMRAIRQNKSVPESVAKCFAVAMFLAYDEIGGYYVSINGGNSRLPEILKTGDQSHYNLFKKDTGSLFGRPLEPEYSAKTKEYLIDLKRRLGAEDVSQQVAAMVAFENHAHKMIEALWCSLGVVFPKINKESLEYFSVHVGGDDPAEAYHTQMTERLIEETGAATNTEEFVDKVVEHYRFNSNWCRDVCEESAKSV